MDEEIRRLGRVAERAGPKALLLGLCDPDHSDNLLKIERDGRRTMRAMLQYVDSLETWTIESVRWRKGGPGGHMLVRARSEAGTPRWHPLYRWGKADVPGKVRANEVHRRFMEAMTEQGADPARPETWVGKTVTVIPCRQGIWRFPTTFAEHMTMAGATPPKQSRLRETGPLPAVALDPDPTWRPGAADEFTSRSA